MDSKGKNRIPQGKSQVLVYVPSDLATRVRVEVAKIKAEQPDMSVSAAVEEGMRLWLRQQRDQKN